MVTLQSLDPIYVNFGVPQQTPARCESAARVRITTDDLPGVELVGTCHGHRLDRGRGDTKRSGAGHAAQSRRQTAARACSCRQRLRSAPAAPPSRCRHLRSATRPTATRSSSSPISRTDNGQTYRGVRQQFVKLGRARGDQIAVVVRRQAGRRGRHLRGLQASQWRRRRRQQQGAARPIIRSRSQRTADEVH